jgi:hypothetical protein
MVNLRGLRTKQNLLKAFAGESQANRYVSKETTRAKGLSIVAKKTRARCIRKSQE